MSIKTDKIKTILSGIEGLEERTKNSDCSTEFRNGKNEAYALVKELIYQQFPELNESDDERIRKEIIDFIQWAEDRGMTRHDYHQAKRPAVWLAYLEKQKELTREAIIKQLEKEFYACCTTPKWFHNTIQNAINHTRAEILGEFNSPPVVCEEEQKPAECIEFDNEFKNQVSHLLASVLNREWEYNKEFVEYTAQQLLGYAKHEISPAEWSDEDEKMLKRVLETYTCYEADIRSQEVLSDNDIEVLHECAEEKIWLKGRFKSLRPQPKQEWSKEDDVMLDKVLCLISPGTKLTEDNADYCVELKRWIVSLQERMFNLSASPWKPSEEQLEALDNARFCKSYDRSELDSLYTELKKQYDRH